MGAAAASPSSECRFVNRATEFGHAVLAFAAPTPTPANDAGELVKRKPTPEYLWIHIGNTGTYKGHHQGEFTLTGDTFAEMVRNFRADPKYGNPRYSVGDVTLDDGARHTGNATKILQFDYEHASEMAPFEGSIPAQGAPAIGWVLELDVRAGDDKRAQLWALAKLGAQIRGQIDREEYDSVSMAWNPAGVHWITGEPIGAVLTSVAFTNHPFIRDLLPFAAANRAAGLGPAGSVQIRAQPVEAHAGGTLSTQGNPMTVQLSAELRSTLCRLYHLAPDAADSSVIRAAENASSTANELAGLLKALGHADASSALAALPDLMAARSKLVDMLAQFDALMRADAMADAEVESQDVAAAFSSRRYTDPTLVHSLAAHRQNLIQQEIAKLPEADRKDVAKVRAARSSGRVAFLTGYGVPANPQHQHLTQTFVAGPGPGGSTQYLPQPQVPQLYSPPAPMLPPGGYRAPFPQPSPAPAPQPLQLSQQPVPGPQAPIDLSAYSGRNTTERVIAYLSSIDKTFAALDHGEKVTRAGQWRRANQHLIVGVAA